MSNLFFLAVAVASQELIYAASGVHEPFFTSKEWVCVARNVEFNQRIFYAVFPYDGILGIGSRAGFEGEV